MTYFRIVIDGDLNKHDMREEHIRAMVKYLEDTGYLVSEAGFQTSGLIKVPSLMESLMPGKTAMEERKERERENK